MRELLGDPGVARYLHERMVPAEAVAHSIAPVVTGDYDRSIHLEDHREPSGRVVCRLGASVIYAAAVEASHGTLARAFQAARI